MDDKKITRDMKPLQVAFQDKKHKIVYIGKRKCVFKNEPIWECIYLCFIRDFMGGKWCSGKIYIAKELVDDHEFNHFDLIIELSKDRMKQGVKRILNEN